MTSGDTRKPYLPMVRDVVEAVCKAYGCEPSVLLGPARFHDLMEPRAVAYIVASNICERSAKFLGHYFGGRDHTSVTALMRRAIKRMASDDDFRLRIENITATAHAIHKWRTASHDRLAATLRRKRQVHDRNAPRF